jgi:hypothetical protein
MPLTHVISKKRTFAICIFCTLLSACQQPDEAACEAFVKAKLASPSSYRAVKVTRLDDRLDWTTYRQRHPAATELERKAVDAGLIGERNMGLTYEASNAYGATIRAVEFCRFRLNDGKLATPDLLVSRAKTEAIARDIDRTMKIGEAAAGIESIEDPACCLAAP